MKRNFLYSIITFYLLSLYCTSQTKLTQVTKPVAVVPVGVDRTVALAADSIASTFMVPETQREEANAIVASFKAKVDLSDSLWAFYQMLQDSTTIATQYDSLILRKYIDSAFVFLKPVPDKVKALKKMQRQLGALDLRVLEQLSLSLLEYTHSTLERAEMLDPLNFIALHDNILTLRKIANITADQNLYLNLRQKLNHYTQFKKGEPDLFDLLGWVNFQLKEYQKAFENFQQAQIIEEKSAIFRILDPDSIMNKRHLIPFDTARIVIYLNEQARAKMKLYDDGHSLSLLRLAHEYAQDEAEKDEIKNTIDWIEWDGGNIRASELNDSLSVVARTNKVGAKNGYLSLLPLLRTRKAADEINWKIAIIDFSELNLKYDAAARMLPIFKATIVDSLGAPIDSTYWRYLNDFGAICYTIGMDYQNQNESKKAYAYFMQSALVNWADRGLCYLNLARLSYNDPAKAIEKCLTALQYPLTKEDQYQAYQLLVQSHVRLGEFDQARKYFNIAQKEKQAVL